MKLILGGNLLDIYQEIYLLVSRLHFEAQYVDSMTPVERRIYLMQYKEEQESEQEEEPADQSRILGDVTNYM